MRGYYSNPAVQTDGHEARQPREEAMRTQEKNAQLWVQKLSVLDLLCIMINITIRIGKQTTEWLWWVYKLIFGLVALPAMQYFNDMFLQPDSLPKVSVKQLSSFLQAG